MNIKALHLDMISIRHWLANIPMPEGFAFYNGGVRCDMIQGPCACGAWHTAVDWPFDIRVVIQAERARGFGQPYWWKR